MGVVLTSPDLLSKLLKHEYDRETCREVVTLAPNANDYTVGSVLGKKADGQYAMCIANAEGTTAVKTVASTDTAAAGDAAAFITFANVKTDLSQKDTLAFTYDGNAYSVKLPSGTLDAAALNAAVDDAKDADSTALGADKVTASFGSGDNANDLILTADATAKTLTSGTLTDVIFTAASTGEHVACAVLLGDVAASASATHDVVVLAHGPAIVADVGLVYDASVNSNSLKLAKQNQLATLGIVTRAAV